MLRKILFIVLLTPIFTNATTIISLLNALDDRPESRLDNLEIEKSALGRQSTGDKLMPTVKLFGGYEQFNTPTGLIPVPPNTMIGMVRNPDIAQPFSKQALRGGIEFNWPIFVMSLYSLEEKADLLHLASRDKKEINRIERQAAVIGAVANLRYLESLQKALDAKQRSIMETLKTTMIMIKEGRTPESALFILRSNINQLEISLNSIEQQRNGLISKIDKLTGIELRSSVPLHRKRSVRRGEIFALRPLEKKLEASSRGMKAANEAYYPTVVTKGSLVYSRGEAYNNGIDIGEHYGTAGVYLSMPLYDRSKSTASQQAKVAYMEGREKLEQTRHNLTVQARELEKETLLLKRSITLARKSVSDQEKLLKIAKVSLTNESISQEEYLRYEDALANARANLYKFEAKEWQDIAQLAVIYGNDLKEIVK
jgi:outer membrane protein TolC